MPSIYDQLSKMPSSVSAEDASRFDISDDVGGANVRPSADNGGVTSSFVGPNTFSGKIDQILFSEPSSLTSELDM